MLKLPIITQIDEIKTYTILCITFVPKLHSYRENILYREGEPMVTLQ